MDGRVEEAVMRELGWSFREIAKATGLNHETARKVVRGRGEPGEDTIRLLDAQLAELIHEWWPRRNEPGVHTTITDLLVARSRLALGDRGMVPVEAQRMLDVARAGDQAKLLGVAS
jgi:transcriptional regulator with XRE-family HTH domain